MLSPDNAALVLAIFTCLIGVVATFILFLIGVRHVQHLNEVRAYRDEASEYMDRYLDQVRENKRLLTRLELGFQTQLHLRAALDCREAFCSKESKSPKERVTY